MILILPKWPPWISIRVPFSAKLRPKTEDFSKPNLPIRKKFGSPLGNVMLEANTNFGENRFSKLHEIMVWSGWYQFPGGQTCIQNLPGPKQRFLVISQNWCGDFPPKFVCVSSMTFSTADPNFIQIGRLVIEFSFIKKSNNGRFWLQFLKVSYYDCFWISNAQVVLKTEKQNFDKILYTQETIWDPQYIEIWLDFVLQILCNSINIIVY